MSSPQVMSPTTDHPIDAIYGVDEAPDPRTLVDIFQATVRAHPDVPGLAAADQVLTYRELAEAVDSVAQRLGTIGIRRGDYVGIRVSSGTTDLYVAILGALHAGAAYVPVDRDDPQERATTVFAEAGVAAVIEDELKIERRFPSRQAEPGEAESAPGQPGLGDDAWVIFTSGSTGTPKGVAVTHRSAGALVDVEAALFLQRNPLGPGDRVMAGLSVAFDASCEEMWLAWRSGATLVAAPRDVVRSGPSLGEWIMDQGITVVSTVPTLASLWPTAALDKVRLLIFGGEACPLDLVLRLHREDRDIWNTYGPTETTVIVSGATMSPEPPVRIGRPIPGWELAVVNPETEEPVSWGQRGELVVGGVGLGRYLDPALDASQYAPLPGLGWKRAYRTGDIVQAEPEGLIFVGRTDDQINLGGKRIELGEVDDHISRLPNVNAGAAALQQTTGGTDVLVCYLSALPGAEIDLDQSRSLLAESLPDGVVPLLTVVEELPIKTSGKVDRDALPWPLAAEGEASDEGLSTTERWMKKLWQDQLGPVLIDPETNFFHIGGGSVQVARLMANIRQSHATAEIRELYANPSLQQMADYIESLHQVTSSRPMPARLPKGPRVFQAGFVAGVYVLNALRYTVAVLGVVWILGVIFEAGWVPAVPFVPVLLGWVLIFSTPGKIAQAAVVARLLTAGVKAGTYPRGGWTHVRVWAAERFLHHLRLEAICGTTYARTFLRLMGNRIEADSHIACLPPVTGLVSIGRGASVEYEADLSGHWVEGDRFQIGSIAVGQGARIGARSILGPNVTVGSGAEVLPGSNVDRDIPARELWGGSPIRAKGTAGESWPATSDDLKVPYWRPMTLQVAEAVGLAIITLLPLAAIAPSVAIVLPQVIKFRRFEHVALVLAAWAPLSAILIAVTWLGLIVLIVRILANWIVPGYFLACSAPGWAVWFTHALLQRTLVSAYPIYSSVATPFFLRALGARIGDDVEISTIETVPHLTWLQDRSFIADHALVTSTRQRAGWVHIGTTVVGQGAFVGNSAIIGPDVDLPRESLVAVLSSAPKNAPTGSSWLGRPAQLIPRTHYGAAEGRTFNPTPRIKRLRGLIEAFRIVPFMITVWIELGMVLALNAIYMSVWRWSGARLTGLLAATIAAFPFALLAGAIATAIAIGAKWVLMGRFRPGEHPLFDGFVWRNELADVFAESLAVPSIIRLSIGSGLFNTYARLMGTTIGRDVWCETWWLPEFDLVRLEDRVTINRGTVLQTHLFQDRVMTLSRTEMETGACLGANSNMLPGARIGARSVVGVGSLVLRDEYLPNDTYWSGNPVQFVNQEEA